MTALVGDAPADFEVQAEAVGLCYISETSEWGTRYVVDLQDLALADQSHSLIQQLLGISQQSEHQILGQIWLETE